MSDDRAHQHRVRIYYEDTDHSGLVYHANYLKYFERAREHLCGPSELLRLLKDDGLGFVVYRAELTYRRGARFGDVIEIHTTASKQSEFRISFAQNAVHEDSQELLVKGRVDLVCVNAEQRLVRIPDDMLTRLRLEC